MSNVILLGISNLMTSLNTHDTNLILLEISKIKIKKCYILEDKIMFVILNKNSFEFHISYELVFLIDNMSIKIY